VPPKQTQTGAKFEVDRGWYEIDGYKCGGQKSTVVFYPRGAGPFHVVVYGHGAWGEIDGSDAWLETVASLGLIVIAPFGGKDLHSCGKAFADDLLNAINGSRAGGAALHPALARANWSRTGLLGHSKGGKYTALAAMRQTDHNIKAFVSSCDVPSEQYDLDMPAMFTTGTLDKFDVDNQSLAYFRKYTGRPKVYTSLQDAYHMEVQEGMRLNILTAQFLSCHVSEWQEDCDVIYGTGTKSLCELNDYAPGGCLVDNTTNFQRFVV
jgi:dienelactone hydrolase